MQEVVEFCSRMSASERELFDRVMTGMAEDGSEFATRRLRQTLRNLNIEIDRDIARKDQMLSQLREVEGVIEQIESKQKSMSMGLLMAALRGRAADLLEQVGDLKYGEKIKRRTKLRQTLLGVEIRRDAACQLLSSLRKDGDLTAQDRVEAVSNVR